MGILLIRGRYFEEYDSETSAPVAIVDDTFARAYWPNEDPVGKRVKLGGRQSTAPWMTIAGVVGHVHYRALEAPSRVQLYWPEAQRPYNTMSLAVRTAREPLTLGLAVEKEILAVDADQPVYQVRSMQQLKSEWVSQRFLALLLVALFADVALVLAAVGIYGVMAHSVALRTHEIGIRMTLGASRTDVLRMILAQGASLTAVGLGIGVLGAIALTRLMKSMLYSVSVTDPLTFLGVALLLVSIALLACYIPARRATLVDPLVALRYE
jgi:putative ABC transport system permease protein